MSREARMTDTDNSIGSSCSSSWVEEHATRLCVGTIFIDTSFDVCYNHGVTEEQGKPLRPRFSGEPND